MHIPLIYMAVYSYGGGFFLTFFQSVLLISTNMTYSWLVLKYHNIASFFSETDDLSPIFTQSLFLHISFVCISNGVQRHLPNDTLYTLTSKLFGS